MFLNIAILKRLMKKAFKEGLIIAQTDKRYYLAGNYWEMDIRKGFLPKEIMACIIELAGEVPEIGDRYKATKEGNQLETMLPMEVDTSGFKPGLNVTKLILIGKEETDQRIIQEADTNNIHLINDVFVQIADNSALQEDKGEYKVEEALGHPQRGILWQNNVARFHAWWRSDENHARLTHDLEMVDLSEDVYGEKAE